MDEKYSRWLEAAFEAGVKVGANPEKLEQYKLAKKADAAEERRRERTIINVTLPAPHKMTAGTCPDCGQFVMFVNGICTMHNSRAAVDAQLRKQDGRHE